MAGRELAVRPDSGVLPSGSAEAQDAKTLGEALRRARQQRGLTIQQITATTRIPARHFEALERNDIGAVPGGMYLRAEVRAYADAVGLSRSIALAYLPAVDPPVAPSSVAHERVASVVRRASTLTVVIASLCLVLPAAVMWAPHRERRPAPTHDIPLEVTADTAVAATSGVNEPGSGSASSGFPSDSALAVTAPPPAATVAEPEPEVVANPPVEEPDLEAVATPPVEKPELEAVATPPVKEPELEVVTEPAGARVTLDGVGWGVTPVTIRYLPPGAKQLRVTRDGYAAEQRLIRISPDPRRTTVSIGLHLVGGQESGVAGP